MSEFAVGGLLIVVAVVSSMLTLQLGRRAWEKERSERLCVAVGSQTFMATVIPFDEDCISDIKRLNTLRLGVVKKQLRSEIARMESDEGAALLMSTTGATE